MLIAVEMLLVEVQAERMLPMVRLKPIHLYSDSRPLFRAPASGRYLLGEITRSFGQDAPSAAYVGASNGDALEFYKIFAAAVEAAGIPNHRMIRANFCRDDACYLRNAGIILLAGGDVAVGLDVFTATGMRDSIIQRYHEGAAIIGISAGAVQLGTHVIGDGQCSTSTLRLVDYCVDVHDEENRWRELRAWVADSASCQDGVGIPTGGAMICHSDRQVEAVHYPLVKFRRTKAGIEEDNIYPLFPWQARPGF